MNSIGIDTFLKSTQPSSHGKPAPTREGRGEFDQYLREAATTQPRSPQEKPAAVEERRTSDKKDKDGPPAGDESVAAKPATEGDENQEEETTTVEPDEVLLSAAAGAGTVETLPPHAPPFDGEEAEGAAEVSVDVAVDGEAEGVPFLPEAGSETADAKEDGSEPATVTTKTVADAAETVVPLSKAGAGEGEAANEQSVVPTALASEPEASAAAELPQAEPVQLEDATAAGQVEAPRERETKSTKGEAAEKSTSAVQAPVAEVVSAVDVELPEQAVPKAASEAPAPAPAQSTNGNTPPPQLTPTTGAAAADMQPAPSEGDSRLPTVDRARFVQRVANAFRSAQQNDGQIQMRLSPPELGTMRIEIAVRNGVLTANLETETADARRVILDNLPALRQRLAEQDIRVEKFDVDVRRDGGQSDNQSGAQDRQAEQQSQRTAAQNRVRTPRSAEVGPRATPRPAPLTTDAGLDVRI